MNSPTASTRAFLTAPENDVLLNGKLSSFKSKNVDWTVTFASPWPQYSSPSINNLNLTIVIFLDLAQGPNEVLFVGASTDKILLLILIIIFSC